MLAANWVRAFRSGSRRTRLAPRAHGDVERVLQRCAERRGTPIPTPANINTLDAETAMLDAAETGALDVALSDALEAELTAERVAALGGSARGDRR